MKIAILTSGILPVPAVQGGAVENLIDYYLEYNNMHNLHDITVYSIWHPSVRNHPAQQSKSNHYKYIKSSGLHAKLKKIFYKITHHNEYYNYQIEYYFEESYKDLKKKEFDYIILENRPGYAYKLTERGWSHLILHLHNDHLHNGKKHAQQLYNSINKIIVVSDFIKKRVQTIGNDDKVITVHNGIDLQRFTAQAQCDINRQSLGLFKNDFIILYSGRINKDKGVSELIDAMLNLKDIPNIKLLILGSTFFGDANNDDDFVKNLKSKSTEIADRITFTGFIPYAQMPNYLSLADVAVIPSIWDDPFPTTVLESQAMGLPIITTLRGGIPEEVTQDNAIILETDNHFIENLANAILDLYQHPEKRETMSKASEEQSKQFDKETYAQNFFSVLDNII